MPAVAWGTPLQVEFLESQLPAFQQAQRTKTLSTFRPELFRAFFERWQSPEDESREVTVPTERQAKNVHKPKDTTFTDIETWKATRRTQILTWLNNRRVNKKTPENSRKASDEPEINRISSELNIYSRKYYDQRVKHIADPQLAGKPEKEHLAIRNRCILQAWKKETPEIKAEVLAAREEEVKAKQEAKTAADKPWTPEGCATALLDMPERMQMFLESQAKRTEWCFSLIAGGPDPTFGKMRTFAIHVGRDTFGNNFKNSHPNYPAHIYEPFVKFLNEVYPPAELARRALKKESTEEGSPDSSPSTTQSIEQEEEEKSTSAHTTALAEQPLKTSQPLLGEEDVHEGSIPVAIEEALQDAPLAMLPPQLTLGSVENSEASTIPSESTQQAPNDPLPQLPPHVGLNIPPPAQGDHAASKGPEGFISVPDPLQINKLPLASHQQDPAISLSGDWDDHGDARFFEQLLNERDLDVLTRSAGLIGTSQTAGSHESMGMVPCYESMGMVPCYEPMGMAPQSHFQQSGFFAAEGLKHTPWTGNAYSAGEMSYSQGYNATMGEMLSAPSLMWNASSTAIPASSTAYSHSAALSCASDGVSWAVTQPPATAASAMISGPAFATASNHTPAPGPPLAWISPPPAILGAIQTPTTLVPQGVPPTTTSTTTMPLASTTVANNTILTPMTPGAPATTTSPAMFASASSMMSTPASMMSVPASAAISKNVAEPLATISTKTPLPSASGHGACSPPLEPLRDVAINAQEGVITGQDPACAGGSEEDDTSADRSRRTRKAPAGKQEMQPWLHGAHTYLLEALDNEGWKKCIDLWVRFEHVEARALETTSFRISAKKRPDVMKKWLVGRKYTAIPQVNESKLALEWLCWWNDLQPKSRQNPENGIPLDLTNVDAKEMMSLRKGGGSGIVTILICLKWWAGIRASEPRWSLAVADVSKCLESFLSGQNKRKEPATMSDAENKRCKKRRGV